MGEAAMISQSKIPVRLLLLAAVVVAAGSCTSRRIVSQWSNPDYANAMSLLQRIMVVGITDQDSIRRNFEDRFVGELRALGADALPSYRFIADPQKPGPRAHIDPPLRAAVQRAKADGILVTRLVRVERHTDVSPGYFEPHFSFGYSRWYSPGWYGAGFYTPPRVYRYPIFYSETTLYDASKDTVIWTGTIRTIDPENSSEAIEEYVETVVKTLKDKQLLRG